MPTYAQLADLATLEPETTAPTGVAGTLLMERAERAIDRLLGPALPIAATGLKVDPSRVAPWVAAAIKRATCAQAAWMVAHPVGELAGDSAPALTAVKGPEFEETYAAPVPGPTPEYSRRTLDELVPLAPYIARTALPRA